MQELRFIGLDKDGIKHYEHVNSYITGLSGCRCHPFKSWEECDLYHNQKLKVGDKVQHRCLKKIGVVNEVCSDKGYYIIMYGQQPNQHVLEHAAQLQLLK